MAKRSRKKITETIAQQTASIPEVVGVPETEFKSAFDNEEKDVVVEKEESEVKEEPKPHRHIENPKPKKKKVKVIQPALNPVSPHHEDSMTSGINFSLGSIL